MEDKELLAAVKAIMEETLEPISKRLESLEKGQGELQKSVDELRENVDELREGQDELRSSVNTLLEWSEGVGTKFDMPLRPAQ